jgi:hypothetical protein
MMILLHGTPGCPRFPTRLESFDGEDSDLFHRLRDAQRPMLASVRISSSGLRAISLGLPVRLQRHAVRVRGIVKTNRVSSGVEVTSIRPPWACAI